MSLNLSMKHVQIDQNGYYRYRRRVPKYAKAFVGKTEFVKVIGKTENEALSNYGDVQRHCDHLFALAKDGAIAASPQVQQEHLEVLLKHWGADPYLWPLSVDYLATPTLVRLQDTHIWRTSPYAMQLI